MRRGDVAVLAISVVLGAVVVAAIVFSVRVVDKPRGSTGSTAANSTSSLLVVTWGPSLCTVERSNPGCRSGHVGQLGPTLILHGLWPQPSSEQFCGVPKGQRDTTLPSLNLPQNLQADLAEKMSDSAIMAPHEWNAHGTCSGLPPAEYFGVATSLAEQAIDILNPVFRSAQGGRVSLDAVRGRLEAELGAGAGSRATMSCRQDKGQNMVAYEVQMSLPPVTQLGSGSDMIALRDVIAKGPTLSGGCRRGSVPR